MATEKIILDVDTGSDDAVAIICAALSSKIELHSICTVWGNRPLSQTTENTLRVVDMLGIGDKVKVYPGCETSMVATLLATVTQAMADREKALMVAKKKVCTRKQLMNFHLHTLCHRTNVLLCTM